MDDLDLVVVELIREFPNCKQEIERHLKAIRSKEQERLDRGEQAEAVHTLAADFRTFVHGLPCAGQKQTGGGSMPGSGGRWTGDRSRGRK